MQKTVSPEEWLAARKDLLAKKKGLTRARDQLAAERFNGKRMIYGGFKVFVSA